MTAESRSITIVNGTDSVLNHAVSTPATNAMTPTQNNWLGENCAPRESVIGTGYAAATTDEAPIDPANWWVRKAGAEQQEYMIWVFTDLLVSSYQTGGSEGGEGS